MIRYVVGFAFNENKTQVLLIKKLKPEWQKGFLNGIGGKIEPDEAPMQAMNRECEEETGLKLNWKLKGAMKGINNDNSSFHVCIFCAFDDNVFKYMQMEKETLDLYSPFVIIRPDYEGKIISNLSFIIPFCLCEDHCKFMALEY